MDNSVIIGVFTLFGALIGGASAIISARFNRKWEQARHEIPRLCREVAAYHKLEEFYKDEVASLRPGHPAAKTVQEEMRTRVERIGDFIRPKMTANEANKICEMWE